jgi:alpha-galactosidase
MKKLLLLTSLAAVFILKAAAQGISINQGWKFNTGDSAQWASPNYNDQHWKSIDVSHNREIQGYPDYDGFGWYRLHAVIPSTLKEQSYLKDSIRINLGVVDDNDEVYLNGKLIAKYGGKRVNIKTSNYGPRNYAIAANNPAILWDKDNVLAVRIFDTGGDGGLYGSQHQITMAGVMDNVSINTDADYIYDDEKIGLSKSIRLLTTGNYLFKGTLHFTVTDPESDKVIYETTNDANFATGKPFKYTFNIEKLRKKSYLLSYTFTDAQSGAVITKTENTPYLLTPYASSKPKINGADVYGARLENPFLYLIPATGKRPMVFKAAGLPPGLRLDHSTGIISGLINQKGTYPVILTVHNNKGSKSKKFSIIIGDEIGLTPALGWNSWNAFGLSVNDAKVRAAAKTMAGKLSQHGWSYINIDDGWEAPQRLVNGDITPNDKFPDMRALATYVHSLGLKMGIYSSPGPLTCGGYLGSWQHEDQDAQTYGNWGIDYLKYDWCSYSTVTAKNPNLDDMKKPYQVMRASLDKVPRDILFSFCQYGMGDVWKWGAEVGGNSWRTTGDINDSWDSMSAIGFSQTADSPYAGPGHFNDPDMLVVSQVGWGNNQHKSHLTPDEQYTHISLWSLLSAPLLIGCDMSRLDWFTFGLLANDEVLAIDQDALGKQAYQAIKTDDYQIWIKDLADGSKAVGIFNTSNKYQTITLNRKENDLAAYTRIRDVWQQKYVVGIWPNYIAKVAPHGVILLKMSK